MNIQIAGELTLSMVNGDGARYVVFVQGCSHNCDGCHNPETHDISGGYSVDIDELAKRISETIRKHHLDGLTLSGGEPYDQEKECIELIKAANPKRLWVYTGYKTDEIKCRDLTKFADVVVTGPFVKSLKCEGKYYGSSNQEMYYVKDDEVKY